MTRVVNECRPPRLVNVATLPCEAQNIDNVILLYGFTKLNGIKCIISSPENMACLNALYPLSVIKGMLSDTLTF